MTIFFQNKKLYVSVVFVLLVVFIFLGIRFFSGNEDVWLCENGQWIRHGTPKENPPAEGCGQLEKKEILLINTTSSLMSPEIIFCRQNNGTIEFRSRGDGKSYAVCVFPRGKECETNSYLEEQCPKIGASILGLKTPAAIYCVVLGGTYRATRDKYYQTKNEKGTCSFSNGRTCVAADFWNGLCERSVPTLQELQKSVSFAISEALGKTEFSGTFLFDDPLIKLYGTTPEIIFQKNSTLLSAIKKLVPSFDTQTMRQGFSSFVITLADNRKLFIFGGCHPDGCSGTAHIAAYDIKKKRMYLLQENRAQGMLEIYGLPEETFLRVLFSVYASLE